MKRINFSELKNLPFNTLVIINGSICFISSVYNNFNWVCTNKTKLNQACSTYICDCDGCIYLEDAKHLTAILPESEEEIAIALLSHY